MKEAEKSRLYESQLEDLKIWDRFLNKKIAVGFSEYDNPFAVGILRKHGMLFCEIINYSHYHENLSTLQTKEGIAGGFIPKYILGRKILNKSKVCSIQSLEDALGENKPEDIFKC